MDAPEMQRYLSSLELTAEDCKANKFFELLDVDGSGDLDVDELISGCLRLRGSAKQIDVCFLRRFVEERLNEISDTLERLENVIDNGEFPGRRPRTDGEHGDPSNL